MSGGSVIERLDHDQACTALERNTTRLGALMRRVGPAGRRAIGSWSIHDVAIHVTDGMENYTRRVQGQPASELNDLRDMAAWNVATVKRLPRVPLPELADRIELSTHGFITTARALKPDQQVPWYAGITIPAVVSVVLRLIEHVIHGYDIATAAHEEWPIARDDAVAMTYGLAYTSPRFVDPERLDFEGAIEIRVRRELPFIFVIEDRELRLETHTSQRIDFHLSCDPIAWVLVSTERMNPAVAAITGRIVGWGLRPLLPFKLKAASISA